MRLNCMCFIAMIVVMVADENNWLLRWNRSEYEMDSNGLTLQGRIIVLANITCTAHNHVKELEIELCDKQDKFVVNALIHTIMITFGSILDGFAAMCHDKYPSMMTNDTDVYFSNYTFNIEFNWLKVIRDELQSLLFQRSESQQVKNFFQWYTYLKHQSPYVGVPSNGLAPDIYGTSIVTRNKFGGVTKTQRIGFWRNMIIPAYRAIATAMNKLVKDAGLSSQVKIPQRAPLSEEVDTTEELEAMVEKKRKERN